MVPGVADCTLLAVAGIGLVLSVYPHYMSKIAALDIITFHHESWKYLFVVRGEGHEAQRLPECFYTLVSAGCF